MIREVLYQHTKNVSNRKLAKALNMSTTTVRKYIKLAREQGYSHTMNDDELQDITLKVERALYASNKGEKASAMKLLLPYKDSIETWLQEPNMTHTQIYRLLKKEKLKVSRRSISRFIKIYFPKIPKNTIHLTTKAGEEGQVDFGCVGKMKDETGKLRKTYAFIMTLSHSRYRYVEFTTTQNQVSWAQLHINAFQFFGGVPSRIILDNLKAGVLLADIYDPTLNETYSELSRFYGFTIDPARAYKPEHKGKVERSVRIVKEQLIAGRNYTDIADANRSAIIWCKEEISQRVCSTTGSKPIDIFLLEEKEYLIKLPSEVFDMPIWSSCKVHKDHHFIVKGNFYSVATKYIGEEINVRIGLKTVSAYYKYKLIKTHPRNYGRGQWTTDEKDYPESALHYLEKTPPKCLSQSKAIGESTYNMISKILSGGSRIGLRKAQAILRLSESYDSSRLETACQRAIAYDNYTYKAISNILKNKLDEHPISDATTSKAIDAEDTAYIRNPEEYSSNMEVNYG